MPSCAQRVDALAGFLQNACGVKRGDRVMIALQNSPQYVIAYYAVMRADAVIVPVNPMNKTAEIAYLADDSGARVAIIGSELSEIFAPLVGEAISHTIVAQYRDEVPAATPYTLPSCVTEAPSKIPPSPGWHSWSSGDRARFAARRNDRGAGRSHDPALHVGHNRQAQGLHAYPSQRAVHRRPAGTLVWARRQRRDDRLHAAVPCRGHAGLDECRCGRQAPRCC